MRKQKRQLAAKLDKIREDHRRRYMFAGEYVFDYFRGPAIIYDLGCGGGYGSYILANQYEHEVYGIDFDVDVIQFGNEHYKHSQVSRRVENITESRIAGAGAVVMFEVIEHLENPLPVLQGLDTHLLIGSVPNENITPFDESVHEWHYRHYTPTELKELIREAGFEIKWWGGQDGKVGAMASVLQGNPKRARTIVFAAAK